MKDCLFCKIAAHEIPTKPVLENEKVIAFPDIHPQAPVHLLVIPKKHIPQFFELTSEDNDILIAIKDALQQLITDKKLDKIGYKLEVNGGGMQDVDHLHFHLMGGWKME